MKVKMKQAIVFIPFEKKLIFCNLSHLNLDLGQRSSLKNEKNLIL